MALLRYQQRRCAPCAARNHLPAALTEDATKPLSGPSSRCPCARARGGASAPQATAAHRPRAARLVGGQLPAVVERLDGGVAADLRAQRMRAASARRYPAKQMCNCRGRAPLRRRTRSSATCSPFCRWSRARPWRMRRPAGPTPAPASCSGRTTARKTAVARVSARRQAAARAGARAFTMCTLPSLACARAAVRQASGRGMRGMQGSSDAPPLSRKSPNRLSRCGCCPARRPWPRPQPAARR